MSLIDKLKGLRTSRGSIKASLLAGTIALAGWAYQANADWIADLVLKTTNAIEQYEEDISVGTATGASRNTDEFDTTNVVNSNVVNSVADYYILADDGGQLQDSRISPTNQNQSITIDVDNYSSTDTNVVFNTTNLIQEATQGSGISNWVATAYGPNNESLGTIKINNGVDMSWDTPGGLDKIVLSQSVNVPSDAYPTIQSAIDDPNTDGATIMLAAGRYNEHLIITNDVKIVGQGMDETFIHYKGGFEVGTIEIMGPGVIELENLEINGGTWTNDTYISGVSWANIYAINNPTIILNHVDFNRGFTYKINQYGGGIFANNVTMDTGAASNGGDIGFNLTSVTNTVINNLVQTTGKTDHTIGLVSCSNNILIKDCVINSDIDGIGISKSDAIITNCLIYGTDFGQDKVGIRLLPKLNYTNEVSINNCVFSNLNVGILYDYGAGGESNTKLQDNNFNNIRQAGIHALDMPINCIDLGGGYLGSQGRNVFVNTNLAAYDILLETSSVKSIMALNNTFSCTNIEEVIYDRLDDSVLPLVIYQQSEINGISKAPDGKHILQWTGLNGNPTNTAGEKFGVDACTNLIENSWFPVASNLTGNAWTNDNSDYKIIFYRNNAKLD